MKRAAGVVAVVAVTAVGAGKERGMSDASADGSGDVDLFVGLPLQMKTMGVEGLRLRARAARNLYERGEWTLYEAITHVDECYQVHGSVCAEEIAAVGNKISPVYTFDFDTCCRYGFDQMSADGKVKFAEGAEEARIRSAQAEAAKSTAGDPIKPRARATAPDLDLSDLPRGRSLTLYEAITRVRKYGQDHDGSIGENDIARVIRVILPVYVYDFDAWLNGRPMRPEGKKYYAEGKDESRREKEQA